MARGALIASLVIALALVGGESFVTDAAMSVSGIRGTDRQFWLACLALVGAPYLLAVLLLQSVHRGYGIALAGGTAATAIVALGPFAALTVLFAGFAVGNRDQLWTIFLLALFVLVQLPIAVTSVIEWTRLAPSDRPPKALAIGILGPILHALVLFAGSKAFIAHGERRTETAFRNQSQAATDFATIVSCLNRHRDDHPESGYPTALDEIASGASPCASPELVRNGSAGYQLRYWVAPASGSGLRALFSLCAEPLEAWETGYEIHVADEQGTLSGFAPRPEDAGRWSCTEVWRSDPARLIKHCALVFATARGTYPPSLADLGPTGEKCLAEPDGFDEVRIDGDWYTSRTGQPLQYVGVRSASGIVTGFEIHRRQPLGGRDVYGMIDETGQVHASADQPATRSDPSPPELEKRFEAEARAQAAELERLEAACTSGSMADCDRLALKVYEPADPARADALWTRACDGGLLRSCLYVPPARREQAMWHLVQERQECEAKSEVGCAELDRMAERDRGCRQGDMIQCREIAYDWEHHRDRDHANELWKAACAWGDAESCYLHEVRDIEYAQVLDWKRRCRRGEGETCSWLAKRVKEYTAR